MPKKKILVLGGGISGLTVAHALSQHSDRFDVTLIEAKPHLGGWVDTDTSTGFLFEKGPRVFVRPRSKPLLDLAHELGLAAEVTEVSEEACGRYVWTRGKLRKVPRLSWGLLKGLYKDLRTKPTEHVDESVWDFACRHFNPAVAASLFDPLVVGVCGGCSKEVSMKLSLPFYKKLEETHGSLFRGMRRVEPPRMVGFARGSKLLIHHLVEKSAATFHLSEQVLSLAMQQDKWCVKTTKNVYVCDAVFSALPVQVLGRLLIPELLHIPLRGATLVHLGYRRRVLKKRGFGYLVPTYEPGDLLGVIFDSNSFQEKKETRLTVMLKGRKSDSEARSCALKTIAKQLKVVEPPDVSLVTHAEGAFPQFLVGHESRMQALEREVGRRYPGLKLAGNYLYGASVSDCIARAKSVVEEFLVGGG